MTRIAVIGAGISGLVAAQSLSRYYDVSVFEKSRGVGGRMATRYAGKWNFDHGAQFFTAKSDSFRRFLEPMIRQRVVEPWCGRFVEIDKTAVVSGREWNTDFPHFVASQNMNSLARHIANDLDVRLNVTVSRLVRCARGWQLVEKDSRAIGEFDWVLVTAPSAQTAALLPDDSPIRTHADSVQMLPCFALMLGFEHAPALNWNAALVRNSAVSWISVNSTKPGRNGNFSLVVHSTNAWAHQHLDGSAETIMDTLCDSASAAIGQDVGNAQCRQLHRWLYANVEKQEPASQVDAQNRLAACGDWFVRGRVEGAFQSAERVTSELLQAI